MISPSAFEDDAFANFADFNNVSFPSDPAWNPNITKRKSSSSPTTPTQQKKTRDTSLSELLAQAKSKSSRRSGNSVNSAPVTTNAAYLRQHHGLTSSSSRSKENGSVSVTDIIQSLEAANAARSKRDDSSSSVRSAIRARRRRERERKYDSSDSESVSGGENWLIDEVTGALGPRGITADLESLSGRSNRSRSSGGGRSHRSHRSHRSNGKRQRHRKQKSSDSVSTGSRRSRNSRYSHRSTRSFISQMSEQSRSVANDLLRLEMQLAMVGDASNGGGGGGGGGGSDGDVIRSSSRYHGSSHSARSHRSKRSAAKRTRITVLAPPGKLGIILANKADAKGTVVSGVRTSSVLADKISPGDRIVAIDGEDVSLMTVSEITTIMARKSEFERTLTVLTTPMSSEPLSPRSDREHRYR
jgi:hypothetical protein